MATVIVSLNPCCSGRWSHTVKEIFSSILEGGLNPCCSGRWSHTAENHSLMSLMECLNPCCSGRWSHTRPYKTILIISKLKNFTKQILTFLNRKLTIP